MNEANLKFKCCPKSNSLLVFILRNNVDHLKTVTNLVRSGWNIIHFDDSTEEPGKDTKVVFSCFKTLESLTPEEMNDLLDILIRPNI